MRGLIRVWMSIMRERKDAKASEARQKGFTWAMRLCHLEGRTIDEVQIAIDESTAENETYSYFNIGAVSAIETLRRIENLVSMGATKITVPEIVVDDRPTVPLVRQIKLRRKETRYVKARIRT